MPFEKGQSGNPATQFQPGQSGNPAGYPAGVPNRGTLLRKLLDREIDYKDPTNNNEQVKGTIEEAMSLAMLAAATGGDVQAYKEVMDSVYGKVTSKVEVKDTTPANYRKLSDSALEEVLNATGPDAE